MVGCNAIGKEEIERRKTTSDFKNDTDNLTFADSKNRSSHGEAAREVRDRKDRLEIKALEVQTDIDDLEDMYNELLKDGF